eukprot:TRINITY_DN884_c2_g1_i1.p2 TRINITY_DN884_c2_g1~~TRINITY_DN884_c2_g1_i1.p2  ORF type:complete len:308 (-),score=80.52 TRINITY_DN884_c2_g1_i1:83-955(-)
MVDLFMQDHQNSDSEIDNNNADQEQPEVLAEEEEEEEEEDEEYEQGTIIQQSKSKGDSQLSSVPLGIRVQIMEERAKNNKKLLKKLFNSDKKIDNLKQGEKEAEKESQFKRVNKNRPMEVSAKVQPAKFREVPGLSGKLQKSWDPRFDRTVGNFSEESFKRRFGFVYDEILPNEIKDLQKQIKQESDPNKKWELKQQLIIKKQKLKQYKDKEDQEDFEKEIKNQQKEAIKAGKKPYYLNKNEKEKLLLKRKYDKLKEEGRLEKVMAKKKKKRAIKDQKILEKQSKYQSNS